jgi:hypothetical protein
MMGGPWPQHPGPQPVGGPWPQQGAAGPWVQGPGGPWVPHQPWAGRRPQHEFTAEENEILAELALWSGILGTLKLVQAVIGILGKNLIGGAIELAVGLSLLGGRKALRAAVDTSGNDVDHLMVAVDKLATVFQLRLILSLLGAIAIVFLVVVFAILAAAGVPLDGLLEGS